MPESTPPCALGTPPAPASPDFPELKARGLRHLARWFYRPGEVLRAAQARHGNTFYTRLPSLGRALVTGEPAIVRATVTNPDLVGGRGTRFLRPLLGEDSLIILEGEAHRARRKLLAPHFRNEAVRRFDAMTLQRAGAVLARLRPGEVVSAAQLARDITLPVIVRLVFGKLDAAAQSEAEAIVATLYHSFANPLFLFLRPLQLRLGGLSPWGRLVANRRRLNRFIDARLDALRAQCHDEDAHGVLADLYRHGDGRKRRHIYHEVISLLLFGHDTGAVSLAWLFYHVHRDPRVLGTLRTELADVSDLAAFCESERSFCAACVRESLRLDPVVMHLTRIAVRDTEVAGLPVARGQAILPSAWLAQRNPEIHARPDEFDPWRFFDGQGDTLDNPYAFFPFGLGARKCIGEPLAMRQLKLILARSVQDVSFELVHPTLPPERQMLLIGPRGGTPLRVGNRP